MFMDLVRKRKTKRVFTDDPLTPVEVQTITEAGELAPTSRNLHSVRLFPVSDLEKIRELAGCKDNGTQALETATFVMAVAADPAVCDVWIEDASIATIFMQMEAEDLGIGSCWIQIRLRKDGDVPAEDNVKRILGLPDGLSVLSLVAFGRE